MQGNQIKVADFGLNQHDQTMLKSFINVLNFGVKSPWIYAKDQDAEVIVVDTDQKEGKQFVLGCKVGKHNGQILVAVGEGIKGCQAAQSLSKPLRSGALRRMFNSLLDEDGNLIDCKISHNSGDLPSNKVL